MPLTRPLAPRRSSSAIRAPSPTTQAVSAETASAKAEQVASAAMRAAETAVKEEMQAAAVVKVGWGVGPWGSTWARGHVGPRAVAVVPKEQGWCCSS